MTEKLLGRRQLRPPSANDQDAASNPRMLLAWASSPRPCIRVALPLVALLSGLLAALGVAQAPTTAFEPDAFAQEYNMWIEQVRRNVPGTLNAKEALLWGKVRVAWKRLEKDADRWYKANP